jgi:hypothetical protein
MKVIPSFLIILLIGCNTRHEKKAEMKPENNQYVFSMDGMDELKIGMKQAEVEKILNKKLHLESAETNGVSYMDSARVTYKGADIGLCFLREYTGDKDFYMWLIGVESQDDRSCTDSGIRIGDGKEKIIDSYPFNKISLGPGYDNDTDTLISKTKYMIDAENETSNRKLVFQLDNKKLKKISTSVVFHDSE